MDALIVEGYALCPVMLRGVVEANSQEEAIKKAQEEAKERPEKFLMNDSSDETNWFDWEPTAERVNVLPDWAKRWLDFRQSVDAQRPDA